MSSYKDLLQQREELDRQIAEARQNEVQSAIDKVRTLVTEFELTADDVFGGTRRASKPGKTGQKVAPKYRDPATGSTWTGRGKPPKWIDGKNREQFIIA